MHLLDDLIERSMNRTDLGDEIEVFDLANSSTPDLNKYVPGLGNVHHTPVVGIWENGVLVERASGARARDLIVDRYKLRHL